ncbi:MAG: nuclear transport factor 2 family protein [Casimicrobiaceae bacterium]
MKIAPAMALAAAGLAWIALAAPAAATKNEAAVAAINAASAAFVKAYNAGDADAVLTHFEEGAVAMPPGMPPVHGLVEIRAFVDKGIAGAKANGITLSLGSTTDAGASGDLGWHSGPYSVIKAGNVIDTGKYLETWHKAGGKWRIIRRIWNSNAPPPIAASPPR